MQSQGKTHELFNYEGISPMASVKRKTVTRSLPSGATVTTKKRPVNKKELEQDPSTTTIIEEIATWKDRNGKKRIGTVVVDKQGERRVRTKSETYYAKYRDGDGIVKEVATGCRDKQAAQKKLDELLSIADKIRVGSLSTSDLEIGDHSRTPVADHVAQYITDLKSRGINADRIKTSETRLKAACEGCGFRWLRDLNSEELRKWLRQDSEMSAATYNWHSSLWVAFGWWLTGRRLEGKRQSQTGERRLASNPFDGFGKRDEKNDRKRIARAMTLDEMQRLLDIAQRRPLEDAQTIRTGPRQGELGANVTKERQAALERLGTERALIYKTLILTGLRANELRTLRVADLSFGDVPFLVLRASNEKNRKGSTVPLKSDLASDLRQWCVDKATADLVFSVPTGLLRILNRDLIAAGIDKMDENEGRIHLHAMRHSTGTHLSAAGVSPRTAQAVMRHSDIALTMNTYTDEKLLQTSAAVELLPELPIGTKRTEAESFVAPAVAPASYKRSQNGSKSDKMAAGRERPQERENPVKHKALRGFDESGRQDLNLRPLRPERSALPG